MVRKKIVEGKNNMVRKKAADSAHSGDADEAVYSYLELRAELDTILIQLQDPACDIDEAVRLYEEALLLITRLESHLESAKNRIKIVQAEFRGAGGGGGVGGDSNEEDV